MSVFHKARLSIQRGILPVILAPAGIQLNRCAFLLYTTCFAWQFRRFWNTMAVSGVLIFGGFLMCSLLGLGYSLVRIRRARWIMAVVGIAIPGAVFTLLSVFVLNHDPWWVYPFVSVVWLAIPMMLARTLFKDKQTSAYFTTDPGWDVN